MSTSPKKYDYTNNIICPYCAHEFSDSWEYNDETCGADIECDSCGKEFHLEVDICVTYSTSPIECEDDHHQFGEAESYVVSQATCDQLNKEKLLGRTDRVPEIQWKRTCKICLDKDYETTALDMPCPWGDHVEEQT